ncbi:hypothetical protein [Candidatus Mycoplasma haematominutum]|uniref:Uncharacterized protein n=1 Tax=Candidatus Mycoplasma haematominutum 'Birmingham 1' TaxID=1116213 RepID=G8C3P0_9MOLU|nr:hypothetical protein [Candidatus Mycoplasma haematominutum]CCE66938.1 hypothetical protein MHM_04200 [Candidatus Mycoplasma haematominutum 'Birmingham 1']
MWSNKTSSWSSTSDSTWRNQCTNGSGYQFIISNTGGSGGNNPEYIGTCSTSSSADNQAWVSIENKTSGTFQLKVCQGSPCWTSSTSSNIHSLSSTSGNWSLVSFKKKN